MIKKIEASALLAMLKNSQKMIRMVWQEKKTMVILLTIIVIFSSLATFLQSGASALLINNLSSGQFNSILDSKILFLTLALIFSAILPTYLYNIQYYFGKFFYFFLEEKFEMLLVSKLGSLDTASHEDPAKNDLLNKVTETGIWRIQNFVDRLFFILQNIIEVVIASSILSITNWTIFFLIVIGSLPELIVEAIYGKDVWGIHTSKAEVRRRYWDLKKHFNHLPWLIELKLFQNVPKFLGMIKELFISFRSEEKTKEKTKLYRQLLSSFLSQIVIGLVIFLFVNDIISGKIQIGTFVFLITSITQLRHALSGLFGNVGRQYQDSLFVTDVFKVLDLQPGIKEKNKSYKIKKDEQIRIEFENVSFAYPNTDKLVLKNFSLVMEPGEKIAIVGVNGAGKTTFVKLLCRFYDPTEGRILVNGHDLKEINLESWYSALGVLFQDYARYHFLVKDVISLGDTNKKINFSKIEQAAKDSEANDFILNWKNSYNQMLGKEFAEGLEPSIGQWQKLALARVLYRDPRVFILDEPTSSIDAEAEAKIFEKLEKLSKEKNVFLISHRFSTVRHANKICVIEKGQISELGSHEQLIKLNGTYAHLFNLQAKGYK